MVLYVTYIMDNQIRSFMRVIRNLDNADELIQSFPKWEQSVLSQNTASPSLNTPHAQRRILDFPDPETQAANIIKSSTGRGKEALLQRAAETPSRLSDAEVSLLKNRYWLDISSDEEHSVSLATGLIMGPSRVTEAEYERAGRRLRAVRQPYYAENEEKAIDNASAEYWRRQNEAWQAAQKQETEKALRANAFSWVRRLWEEDKGDRYWGYTIFVDPDTFVDEEEAERYMARRDGVLFHARGAIGAGSSAINNMWRLQKFDWLMDTRTVEDGEKESADGCQPVQQRTTAEEACREKERIELPEDTAHEKRAAKFQKLREHFRSIRDQGSRRQSQEQATLSIHTSQPERGGIVQDGILQNVFLVDDKYSAGSVLSGPGFVDDMWIWAIDPDHDVMNDKSIGIVTTGTSQGSTLIAQLRPNSYQGFMRVRLQQIVNNFYDARRFHGTEYSMEKLWEAAQKSKQQAFVSLKDEEARSWTMDRFIGSAMRAQPSRIVYGLKPVVSVGTSSSS